MALVGDNDKKSLPSSDLNKYPNASYASRGSKQKSPKEKEDSRIADGHVVLKKKSAFKKFKHKLFAEDGANLGDYIINDVLVPAIKATISDSVTNGIDILLYGEARHGRSTRANVSSLGTPRGPYVPYSSGSSVSQRRNIQSDRGIRGNLALDDFIFTTRIEANDILERMNTIVEDYGMVTVADLYDMCGLRSVYTYNNYVWRDLSTAGVSMVRDGYLLNLPTPQALD